MEERSQLVTRQSGTSNGFRYKRASLYCLFILIAAALRLVGLPGSGVIYQDDLRGYSGVDMVQAMSDSSSLKARFSETYRISVEHTGARPALAWLAAAPAALGARRIGVLYVPFAILGVLAVLLTAVLTQRMFNERAGIFAGLYLAVSAAAVNYSRSALPPMPAIVLMLLGLIALNLRPGCPGFPSAKRVLLCGTAFAGAILFHPAYLLYLSVPAALIAVWPNDEPILRSWATRLRIETLLALPIPVVLVAYDVPNVLFHAIRGGVSSQDFVYLQGLRKLLHNPAVYGSHEGVLFWPRYLVASNGLIGSVLLLAFIAIGLLMKRRAKPPSLQRLIIWMVVPWILWAAWMSVNSYARLYAPLLVPLAALIGVGAAGVSEWADVHFSRHVALAWGAAICLALSLPSALMSLTLIRNPGPEPMIAAWAASPHLRNEEVPSVVIGFERSDARALQPIRLIAVFTPQDLRNAYCSRDARYLILSPAALYLAIRHYRFLSQNIALDPIRTFKSPFRAVPLRLFEGQSPQDRQLVLRQRFFSQLGVYRINAVQPECADTVTSAN
jgi:hypothetical protein